MEPNCILLNEFVQLMVAAAGLARQHSIRIVTTEISSLRTSEPSVLDGSGRSGAVSLWLAFACLVIHAKGGGLMAPDDAWSALQWPTHVPGVPTFAWMMNRHRHSSHDVRLSQGRDAASGVGPVLHRYSRAKGLSVN